MVEVGKDDVGIEVGHDVAVDYILPDLARERMVREIGQNFHGSGI